MDVGALTAPPPGADTRATIASVVLRPVAHLHAAFYAGGIRCYRLPTNNFSP